MPIKDVFTNDWCEVKENTLIFQYLLLSKQKTKVQEGDSTATYCPSVEEARRIADIFLKGVENYEIHRSKNV